MTIELESMAVEMPEVEGHPNRDGFRGVLTLVDVPSERAPSGIAGTSGRADAEGGGGGAAVADWDGARLCSVAGPARFAAESGSDHERGDRGTKSGDWADTCMRKIFLRSWRRSRRPGASAGFIDFGQSGPRICCGRCSLRTSEEGSGLRTSSSGSRESRFDGGSFDIEQPAEKHPDMVLRAQAAAVSRSEKELGMSYEVTDVEVVDRERGCGCLTQVMFTGAAVLRREKAAYQDTWIELSASRSTSSTRCRARLRTEWISKRRTE